MRLWPNRLFLAFSSLLPRLPPAPPLQVEERLKGHQKINISRVDYQRRINEVRARTSHYVTPL